MAISFLVVLIYVHISRLIYCKILRKSSGNLPKARKNRISLLRIAMAIWTTIVIQQIIHYGVLNMLLISTYLNVLMVIVFIVMYLEYLIMVFRFQLQYSSFCFMQTLKTTSILSHYQIITFQIWTFILFILLCFSGLRMALK